MFRYRVLPPAMKFTQSANFNCCFHRNGSTRLIHSLLSTGRPSAVSRLIVSLALRPTVQRRSWRAWPHVGKEVSELAPAFADRNTSRSVVGVPRALLIRAPGQHTAPACVGWGSIFSMNGVSLNTRFIPKTSARLHQSANQVIRRRLVRCTAVAKAKPKVMTSLLAANGLSDESAKSATGKVVGFGHGEYFTTELLNALTGLFQRLTREADDINAAYASCRADAWAVRAGE